MMSLMDGLPQYIAVCVTYPPLNKSNQILFNQTFVNFTDQLWYSALLRTFEQYAKLLQRQLGGDKGDIMDKEVISTVSLIYF